MKSPFIKFGKSYVDVRSIERMKITSSGSGEPAVKMWFKDTKKDWLYTGSKYNMDKMAKKIAAYYSSLPEKKGEETSRFDLMEVEEWYPFLNYMLTIKEAMFI